MFFNELFTKKYAWGSAFFQISPPTTTNTNIKYIAKLLNCFIVSNNNMSIQPYKNMTL